MRQLTQPQDLISDCDLLDKIWSRLVEQRKPDLPLHSSDTLADKTASSTGSSV